MTSASSMSDAEVVFHDEGIHSFQAIPDLPSRQSLEERLLASETANRLKSDFLANMSHEIRTPMNAVLGYTELLLSRVQNKEDRLALESIRRSGDHLLFLVNDLLDLAKIESGQTEVDQQATLSEELLDSVAEILRVKAEEKGLAFTVEHDPHLPKQLLVDERRLKQILINLAGNAIKFTQTGSVTIRSRLVKGDLSTPLWEIAIIDTGLGISTAGQQKIFNPYVQANQEIERTFGGTGLGLVLSARLAELMGGDIQVESELGQGSTFRLRLPALSPPQMEMFIDAVSPYHGKSSLSMESVDDKDLEEVSLAGCEILLAEDGPDNRRLLEYILKQAGARLTSVENGRLVLEEVLKRASTSPPQSGQKTTPQFNLLVMDMQMPFMDGYQAASRLRELDFKQPIVALTAHAMPGDRDRCLEAGCTDYLTKPIKRNTLLKMLGRYARQPI